MKSGLSASIWSYHFHIPSMFSSATVNLLDKFATISSKSKNYIETLFCDLKCVIGKIISFEIVLSLMQR